jgi:hypothetical protein
MILGNTMRIIEMIRVFEKNYLFELGTVFIKIRK